MVILLLHNRYREHGGEERAVAEQAALLRGHGHRVEVLERSSGELSGTAGRARAARALLRGGEHEQEVAGAVRRLGADVVHAHNIHPLFGFRALEEARSAGARTVLQLHNFRLFCAIGVAYRDGAVCHRCTGRNTLPGVRLRCRGGLAESAVYGVGLARQQPRILAAVDRFITLSEATRRTLAEAGLPLERAEVLANPLAESFFSAASRAAEGAYALCAGRLVEEKGFDVAIRACAAAGVPLRIAGSGPEEGRLRALGAGSDVRLLGHVEAAELARLRAGAALALAPSRCEEQSPYAVLEAMAAGVPPLVSDLGGLPELAGAGAALAPADAEAWSSAVLRLWRDPGARREAGGQALARARERVAPERVYSALMGVYARAGVRPDSEGVAA